MGEIECEERESMEDEEPECPRLVEVPSVSPAPDALRLVFLCFFDTFSFLEDESSFWGGRSELVDKILLSKGDWGESDDMALRFGSPDSAKQDFD
jgi:hypothetical protein